MGSTVTRPGALCLICGRPRWQHTFASTWPHSYEPGVDR